MQELFHYDVNLLTINFSVKIELNKNNFTERKIEEHMTKTKMMIVTSQKLN